MTEESYRRHGMNGNADSGAASVKEECPRSTYSQGGRLKFFKDGKFILELERAREGERVSWVSVPRKTFWPPQGTAPAPSYRQESSTSLSVSDDNSSIQSSPWQRDHSWKQTTPRRNLSKEMTFFFSRKKCNLLCKSTKCRRPYSGTPEPETKVFKSERTSVCNNKLKKTLATVVQSLIDKNTSSTPPRSEMVVSPRKRFLREMEKDKVQADDGQKRSRSKTQSAQCLPSSSAKVSSPVRVNGTTEEPRKNCSYSITSLLAEDRVVKRSPENSPSHFTPATQAQYCSPPPPQPEDGWYTESVDRLRSIELSHVDKRAMSAYQPYHYMPPYVYPYSLPPPYYSAPPSVYGRNYMMSPVYSAPPLPLTVRHDTPTCSWAADATRDSDHREENVSDMPLNLSKHAG